jgi:hypothetical protein
MVSILVNHVYNLSDKQHFRFPSSFKDIDYRRSIPCQIDVHPHFHSPFFVQANLVLLDVQRLSVEEYVIKALEAGFEQIEVFGEWKIGDLAKSKRDMLDI